MAISLIAILLTLLLSHALPELPSWRNFTWVRTWALQLQSVTNSGFRLAATLGIPTLLCYLVQTNIHNSLFGFLYFFFALTVLLYCWGPRDLPRDVEAIFKAPDSERREAAVQALRVENGSSAIPLQATALVDACFQSSLKRWFGVLFWFVVLGPAGALLYRMTQIVAYSSASETENNQTAALARNWAQALDWFPAHLMALSLALVSDFDAVFRTWRDYHAAEGRGFFTLQLGFLSALAHASVDADVVAETERATAVYDPLLELADALQLLHRVLMVWLTVLALIVLGGWAA